LSYISIYRTWLSNFLQDFEMFFELLSFIVCPCVLIFTRHSDDLTRTALHVHHLSVYNVVCVLCMLRVIIKYLTTTGYNGFVPSSRCTCTLAEEKTSLAHLLILENTILGRTVAVNLYDESTRF